MRDSCGRTIDYLRLSVTDLCNYRCQYCMPPEGVEKRLHSDILSIEELAENAGTITNELFSRLGARVEGRCFRQEA